jgi:hypothetical protein
MKVIDAFWEKRNLNIETKEIILSESDSLSDIEEVLVSLSSGKKYIVAKIPVGKPDFIRLLTDNGFYFVESLFEMSLRITDFQLPEHLKRFDEMFTYRKLTNNEDFERLEGEIKNGIFSTDRIALDPNFGIDVSAIRYINWLRDEVQKGGEIFEVLSKEKPVGFFSFKDLSNGKYDVFLGGMYRNEFAMGLGFSLLSKEIIELQKRQAKLYVTHISSNNLAIIRLFFSFGFSPVNIVYVMTKFQDV